MMMFFSGRRLDLAEHVLGAVLAGDAAEDHAVQERVPAEAVVACAVYP